MFSYILFLLIPVQVDFYFKKSSPSRFKGNEDFLLLENHEMLISTVYRCWDTCLLFLF